MSDFNVFCAIVYHKQYIIDSILTYFCFPGSHEISGGALEAKINRETNNTVYAIFSELLYKHIGQAALNYTMEAFDSTAQDLAAKIRQNDRP